MSVRAICAGKFTLPVPIETALPLFTPEGERRWAGADWDPQYPVERGNADGSAPGTVFTTESTGGAAIWIVSERSDDAIRYARVVPGRIAGTVGVTCAQAQDGGSDVRVTYDITSLGPEGDAFVRELERGYDAFFEHWRQAILASLTAA